MNASPHNAADPPSVELPRPTIAPLVLSAGIAMAAIGIVANYAFLIAGALVLVAGLGIWIGQLLPGRGHVHEPLVEPSLRPAAVTGAVGEVEHIRRGMPGYRLRLPERVHPISAGIKGGIVGGLVMPLPAMLYGVLSGHGIWLPINMLAGMVLPGVDQLTVTELEEFRPTLVATGAVIHACVSLILGLIYGVLMPMLPRVAKPLAWGAVLMPLFWTAISYAALGTFNPAVRARIDWPWFVVSQFIFGVVAAIVFLRLEKRNAITAGALCGIAGGLLMPIPALSWAIITRHSIWYPINLLSAMAMRHAAELPANELEQFHAEWLVGAIALHALLSISFGLAFAFVLPRIPSIPTPMVWGGLIMPLLWTASSYALMGVVNPVLQEFIEWPWFIASQFVFGVVASMVVVRSEMVYTEPAGAGPEGPN
jgi:hypothetical protein